MIAAGAPLAVVFTGVLAAMAALSYGLSATWSVPTLCLLAAYVARRWTGRELMDARALRAAWLFGGTAGVVVLTPALSGLVGPYGLGWGAPGLPALVWVVTATLIVARNRFGLVLGLGVLAFDLRLLESRNLWDYLVDPVFALVSLIALARSAVRRAARLRPGLPAAPHDT